MLNAVVACGLEILVADRTEIESTWTSGWKL